MWDHITEVGTAALVPIFAFSINWIVRARLKYALSAAADFALALMAFDLTALVLQAIFEDIIQEQYVRDLFRLIFLAFLVAILIAWGWKLLSYEHKLVTQRPANQSLTPFLRGWAIVGSFLAAHILTFMYGAYG